MMKIVRGGWIPALKGGRSSSRYLAMIVLYVVNLRPWGKRGRFARKQRGRDCMPPDSRWPRRLTIATVQDDFGGV